MDYLADEVQSDRPESVSPYVSHTVDWAVREATVLALKDLGFLLLERALTDSFYIVKEQIEIIKNLPEILDKDSGELAAVALDETARLLQCTLFKTKNDVVNDSIANARYILCRASYAARNFQSKTEILVL
jgi:hypothetical protein